MRAALYEEMVERVRRRREMHELARAMFSRMRAPSEDRLEMGLAAGGRMQQEVYTDPHGLKA